MFYKYSTISIVVGCSGKKDFNELSEKKEETTNLTNQDNVSKHLNYDDQKDWVFTSGNMQSPIDIVTSKTETMYPDSGKITFKYGKDVTKAENNGHSIEITDGGASVINGRNFELSQFHFHAESEHTINGRHFPMEVHFVNKSQDGRIAVIGVFFKKGAINREFQEVLDDINNEKTDPITDLEDMIPTKRSYYHYLGSLTTPPLNENVEWYVMKEPVEVSPEQSKAFKKLYSHNNREIQPINNRIIVYHEE